MAIREHARGARENGSFSLAFGRAAVEIGCPESWNWRGGSSSAALTSTPHIWARRRYALAARAVGAGRKEGLEFARLLIEKGADDVIEPDLMVALNDEEKDFDKFHKKFEDISKKEKPKNPRKYADRR